MVLSGSKGGAYAEGYEMKFKLRSELRGPHVNVDVFIGEGHLAHVGRLTMLVGEWQLFGAALGLGAKWMHGQLIVESEGDDAVIEALVARAVNPAGTDGSNG